MKNALRLDSPGSSLGRRPREMTGVLRRGLKVFHLVARWFEVQWVFQTTVLLIAGDSLVAKYCI